MVTNLSAITISQCISFAVRHLPTKMWTKINELISIDCERESNESNEAYTSSEVMALSIVVTIFSLPFVGQFQLNFLFLGFDGRHTVSEPSRNIVCYHVSWFVGRKFDCGCYCWIVWVKCVGTIQLFCCYLFPSKVDWNDVCTRYDVSSEHHTTRNDWYRFGNIVSYATLYYIQGTVVYMLRFSSAIIIIIDWDKELRWRQQNDLSKNNR